MHTVYCPTQHQASDVLHCILAVNIIWTWTDNGQILTETCKFQIYIVVSDWPIASAVIGTFENATELIFNKLNWIHFSTQLSPTSDRALLSESSRLGPTVLLVWTGCR